MIKISDKLENLRQALFKHFDNAKDTGTITINSDVKSLRKKQLLFLSVVASVILAGGLTLYLSGEHTPSKKKEKPVEKAVSDIATPLTPIDERETWVSRVEKKAESFRQEADQVRQENQLLTKRVDVLEELLSKPAAVPPISETSQQDAFNDARARTQTNIINPSNSLNSSAPFQKFPPVNNNLSESHQDFQAFPGEHGGVLKSPKIRGPKIAHIVSTRLAGVTLKSAETYLPAGTYCKAVVDMGVAASTATNAQGNPEPIKLRLVDDGNLPGGIKGYVKDAVLIGACYGDISSERARCRLETITWKDKTGKHIEKNIEGWVVGEDGLAGLRGKVVDRSSDVAREAFGAGILSAAANFLKFEATAGAYPMTPFGQTNALNNANAIKGAAATGASNALDKLADFSIKRAEQMQPVILVASGRVVDVLLKSGVSLTPDTDNQLKVIGSQSASVRQENNSQESQEG